MVIAWVLSSIHFYDIRSISLSVITIKHKKLTQVWIDTCPDCSGYRFNQIG